MPPWCRRRKETTPHCYLGVANEAMKLRAAPGAQRVGKTFERGGVWVSHHPVVVDAGYRGKNTPEGGVKTPKKFTSGSRLNTREVEAMAAALKPLKSPAPARIWMRGRRWWWVTCRKNKKNHLRLAFGRKGGGGGGSLGITGVSGGRRKNEWEKTGNDICRCPFSRCTSAWASHFLGPPLTFLHPSTPSLVDYELPTSL